MKQNKILHTTKWLNKKARDKLMKTKTKKKAVVSTGSGKGKSSSVLANVRCIATDAMRGSSIY